MECGTGCNGCGFAVEEEVAWSVKDMRRLLRCGNEQAGHRCGWVMKISGKDGRFGDAPAPAWCPLGENIGEPTLGGQHGNLCV